MDFVLSESFILAVPIVGLVVVLAIPIAYFHHCRATIRRPKLFLCLTIFMGLVIAEAAAFWIVSYAAFTGTAGDIRLLEISIIKRTAVAALLSVAAEFLICRISHAILRR
jgi:hypothetical protein